MVRPTQPTLTDALNSNVPGIHWPAVVGARDAAVLVDFTTPVALAGNLAAARTDIDASVGYYGVMIDQMLNESHAIANHLVLHIAGDDGFVPPEAQQAMHAGLDDHPKVTLHDYEGLDHGFAAEMGNRRDEAGAQLADSRTEAFLKANLA